MCQRAPSRIQHPDSKTRKTKTKTKPTSGVLGGVYHTSLQNQFSELCQNQDSATSCSTSHSIFSESTDGGEDSVSSSTWNSSDSPSHHSGAPLLIRSAVNQRKLGASTLCLTDEEVLGRVMIYAANLPQAGQGYFASNHVMVNNERTKHMVVPLKRNRTLDDIAREHASQMAKQQSLFHADPVSIEEKVGAMRIGANVGKGPTVRAIHKYMMASSISDRNNIIDRRFVSMGFGTAKGSDGKIYMCQIFSD